VSYKWGYNANTANDILGQNAPNPVTSSTEIEVDIPENGTYKLTISDNNGNIVKVIANGQFNAGKTNFNWDATNENGERVTNGAYFYTLEGDNTHITKSLMIAR
jgi:flagellar hook assembly protein FlgD